MNIPLIIPPITITIKANDGRASKKVDTITLNLTPALPFIPLLLARKKVKIIQPTPHKIPGIYPAINRAATDVPPLTREYTINEFEGGISNPVGAVAMLTVAPNFLSYPSSSSIGNKIPPIAAQAATEDPEIAPNIILANTLVCIKDPGTLPVKD